MALQGVGANLHLAHRFRSQDTPKATFRLALPYSGLTPDCQKGDKWAMPVCQLPNPLLTLAQTKEEQKLRSENTAKSQGSRLQALAYEAAMQLKECQTSEEDAARARAHAQAVSSLIRAWKDAREQVRKEQGKPDPGVLRPEKPTKPRKARPTVLPPIGTPSGE